MADSTSNRTGAHFGRPTRPRVEPVDLEVDLHGMTVKLALSTVERHLQQAHRARLHVVKVIHGHGTGALKTAVQRYLSDTPLVRRHYFASHGDGGHGVTIAELDYGKGKPFNRKSNYGITPKAGRWK